MTLTPRQLNAFIVIDVILVVFALWYFGVLRRTPPPIGLEHFQKGSMRLTSTAFAQNEPLPKKYTCQADSVSPPLSISQVPTNAQSLALIVEDPDAPSGTFTHWVVWNIPPTTKEIAEGSLPPGAVLGMNAAKQNAYAGPCPSTGTHRYFFKLFALDETVSLDAKTDAKALLVSITPHIVAQTALEGTYRKY